MEDSGIERRHFQTEREYQDAIRKDKWRLEREAGNKADFERRAKLPRASPTFHISDPYPNHPKKKKPRINTVNASNPF